MEMGEAAALRELATLYALLGTRGTREKGEGKGNGEGRRENREPRTALPGRVACGLWPVVCGLYSIVVYPIRWIEAGSSGRSPPRVWVKGFRE